MDIERIDRNYDNWNLDIANVGYDELQDYDTSRLLAELDDLMQILACAGNIEWSRAKTDCRTLRKAREVIKAIGLKAELYDAMTKKKGTKL